MELCPEGQEGAYSAFASLPLYLSKLFAGGLAGTLLEDRCPEEGPCDRSMWLIIGLVSLSSPVLLTLVRPFIDPAKYAASV